MSARRRAPRDAGAAAVEFALVMPLLFILIFGVIQYGYGFFQIQAAQATVREAARSAALGLDDCGGWTAAVDAAAVGNGMATDAIDRRLLRITNDIGTTAPPERGDTLTATLVFTPSLHFIFVPFPATITRTARTTVEDIGDLTQQNCG